MVANFCRATDWSSPININELVGCGLVSAIIRSFAAYMVASCADMLGMLQWVGKNSTVSQILCALCFWKIDLITSIIFVNRAQTTDEMFLERVYGSFSCVASVDVWWCKLVFGLILVNEVFQLFGGLIV